MYLFFCYVSDDVCDDGDVVFVKMVNGFCGFIVVIVELFFVYSVN